MLEKDHVAQMQRDGIYLKSIGDDATDNGELLMRIPQWKKHFYKDSPLIADTDSVYYLDTTQADLRNEEPLLVVGVSGIGLRAVRLNEEGYGDLELVGGKEKLIVDAGMLTRKMSRQARPSSRGFAPVPVAAANRRHGW